MFFNGFLVSEDVHEIILVLLFLLFEIVLNLFLHSQLVLLLFLEFVFF